MTSTSERAIIIRADADSRTGMGHLVRSCALAAMLSKAFPVRFASFNADGGGLAPNRRREIEAAGAIPVLTDIEDRKAFDKAFLEQLHPYDVAVLDNYYFTTEYQQEVRDRCHALAIIDEMHLHSTPADLLFCFVPLSREVFKMAPYTQFYSGIERAFLRPPFLAPLPEKVRPDVPRNVFVAMGGTDPMGLNAKMSRVAHALWPGATVSVVAPANVDKNLFGEYVRLYSGLSAEEMASLLDESDTALIPASTLCVEAFARRVPVIGGWFVDNQADIYRYCADRGLFTPAGSLLDSEETIVDRIRKAPHSQAPDLDFHAWEKEVIKIFTEV